MTRITAARTITKMKTAPAPSRSDIVRASEGRKLDAGGRRMPGGVMPPDAAEALAYLQEQCYGSGASACIYRALVEAAERMRKA